MSASGHEAEDLAVAFAGPAPEELRACLQRGHRLVRASGLGDRSDRPRTRSP
ncbi:hypothetical protein ACNFR7_09870 [Streptomyces sp. RM1]|uniref:hypothetical protein n=1 Tax=Streptomyces misionensis TaxID=67331 RepID=UPI003BAFA9C9